MNDYREASFVVQEMLPSGHYRGRLTEGVAQQLSRRLPSVEMPTSLVLDLQVVESEEAFRIFVQALAAKRLTKLTCSSSLSLTCVAILADSFQAWQLETLEVHVREPSPTTPPADVANLFRRLADLCTANLHLHLAWPDIGPVLMGLKESRAPTSDQPRVSLTLAYVDAATWNEQARQIQAHHFVHGVTIRGGAWGPASWSGLARCLQTPSLCRLTLSGVTFREDTVDAETIRALQQALYSTRIREFQFVDIQGSARGGSLDLVRAAVASMASRDVQDEYGGSSFWNNNPVCSVQSLTLKTRLSVVLDDQFLSASHAVLAEHLPRMRKLRTLHTRWQPSTSGLLWHAVRANESLTRVSTGKTVGRMLEPVLQRNRLLRATHAFGKTWRTLDEVVEFAQNHSLVTATVDPAQDVITASASYWLMRTFLPHNCPRACSDRLASPQPPPTAKMMMDDESSGWDTEEGMSERSDATDVLIMETEIAHHI